MMHKLRKHIRWGILYGIALAAFTAFVLLDTFVIPRSYTSVKDTSSSQETKSGDTSTNVSVKDGTYKKNGVSIKLTTDRYCKTTVYVADITVSNVSSLKTALAENTFGKNITETTSSIAKEHNAILAINGDYYGAQMNGYVIRNGTVYRDTSAGEDQEDLVIQSDGSFSIIKEGDVTAQELKSNGAWQVLSFGPGLVENGKISVSTNEEVGRAQVSNPRTAICEIAPLHYVMVVVDGRTSKSSGLSLYQLAKYIKGLGATTAYNLDGGGSSTMYFNGEVVNQPTTNGNEISERKVSDIVYLGA